MKTVYLIRSRIIQYWRIHKSILILFLFGGILNALMFSYLYGNLVSYMLGRDSSEIYYRKYSVYYIDNTTFDIDKVKDLYQTNFFDSIMLSTTLPDGDNRVIADINDTLTLVCEKGTDDLTKNKNAVIIPSYVSGVVGDSVKLLGKEFTVIGQHTVNDYYVSFDNFKELNSPIDRIYLIATNRQDFSNDKVQQLLRSYYPSARISTPSAYEAYDESTSYYGISIVCITYAIALCTFMFLLRYLMDSMLNSTIISMIVGATKKRIFTIVFLEAFSLCAAVNVLGIALHQILYPCLFSIINLSQNLVYKTNDYILIFTLMQFVALIVAVPFTVKYSYLSPVESRRYID